tara:strand:- start:1606 stop:1842 length:237 start_codon:yes stop_codon:yes gene_type:complete
MEVILYSKKDCQWCERAKMLFNNLDIKYTEYKYQNDFTKKEFYAEFGEGATFPQISINTRHIGGFKDTLHYLQETKFI